LAPPLVVGFNFSLSFGVIIIFSLQAAGQRCMAISVGVCHRTISCLFVPLTYHVAIIVGETTDWLPGLVERAKLLKINGGFEKGADL
jgi:malonate-semialdehyde dehydrogenase (acetylating)/methylmalonate-semialdehyde dehydrogenase